MNKWIVRAGAIIFAGALHTLWRESIRDLLISYDDARLATLQGGIWGAIEGLVVLGIVIWAWRATRDKNDVAGAENSAHYDEVFWEKADSELTTGQHSKGLWAKCFSDSGGDGSKARAQYLKLRVEQLRSQQAVPIMGSTRMNFWVDSYHENHLEKIVIGIVGSSLAVWIGYEYRTWWALGPLWLAYMMIFETKSFIRPAKEGSNIISRSILFRATRDIFTAIVFIILTISIISLLAYFLITRSG
jgi:hypothetical protein